MKLLHYKIGFALYWLFFAVLSVFAAQSPGRWDDPKLFTFSWLGLAIIWTILASLVVIFYFILKPAIVGKSSSRISGAFALSVALVAASILTWVTDMSELYYMPHYFSFLTFLILLLVSTFRAGRALWCRMVRSP